MTQPPDYGQTPPPSDGGYGSTPPPPPPAPGASGGAYSVGDAFNYGLDKFKANVGPSIILALIVLLASAVFGGAGQVFRGILVNPPKFDISTGTYDNGTGFFVSLIATAILTALTMFAQFAIGAVIARAGLQVTEGKAPSVGDALAGLPWGKVIIVGLIQSAIIFIGLVLCIIPGLIAMFLLYYATYFVLDKGMEPVEAIKASVELVRANVGSALVWAIVAYVVTVVGMCLCGVGLLVALPIATYGTAYTYKKLTGQAVAA